MSVYSLLTEEAVRTPEVDTRLGSWNETASPHNTRVFDWLYLTVMFTRI